QEWLAGRGQVRPTSLLGQAASPRRARRADLRHRADDGAPIQWPAAAVRPGESRPDLAAGRARLGPGAGRAAPSPGGSSGRALARRPTDAGLWVQLAAVGLRRDLQQPSPLE